MTDPIQPSFTRAHSMGWMIQRVARRMELEMEQRLTALDLTVRQFAVMMMVLEHDGLTQTELGAKFLSPAYAISRTLDHLQAVGFVERRPHPTSRRTHTVHATPPGRALGAQLFEIVNTVNAEFTKDFTEEECALFRSLLMRLL